MDPRIMGYSNSMGVDQFWNYQYLPVSVDHNSSDVSIFNTTYQDLVLGNGPGFVDLYAQPNEPVFVDDYVQPNEPVFVDHYVQPNEPVFVDDYVQPNEPVSGNLTSNPILGVEDDFNEDCDLSGSVLTYINRMLMEEDLDDKNGMLQESLELQAKVMSFYEALATKDPQSTEIDEAAYNKPNEDFPENDNVVNCCGNEGSNYLNPDDVNYHVSHNIQNYKFNSSITASTSLGAVVDGIVGPPVSPVREMDLYNVSQSIWNLNFNKGVEEASKFLPTEDFNGLLPHEEARESRGRKNPHSDEMEEGRSSKQAAVYTESTIRSEEFDIVLLHSMGKGEEELKALRARLKEATHKNVQQNAQLKGAPRGNCRGRKQSIKKQVDLRTLLVSCSEAVAAEDLRNTNAIIKQIRQHSSPLGDGDQRLASYLADAIEARLAGMGTEIYKMVINKPTSAVSYLKAYHAYLATSPFRKISTFACNKTAMIKAKKATRVHVIDFGILYGFQWPTFMQRISTREGGPPKLRITGIEFPQPGFRPAERIEETGRRLADYAQTFNVPFEYNPIAKRWETIVVEDLKLEEGEFVFVNCLYRFKNLYDETVISRSTRGVVLSLIKRIKPDIFIHGIVNGSYSAPFFVTRFREALFHFSSLFDMLETNVPRDLPERLLIEREIFGREAMNVVACEGWERVERPETYKQWHLRHLRAGLSQVPFPREVIKMGTDKVRSNYHKDFGIDEDRQWMLLQWKGRIMYALSCWTSA